MTANRTTIYLSDSNKRDLKTMTDITDMTQSELIRTALRHYSLSDEFKRQMKVKKELDHYKSE